MTKHSSIMVGTTIACPVIVEHTLFLSMRYQVAISCMNHADVQQQETQRLTWMHQIIMMKTNRLVLPNPQALRRVLDCGTGNGSWAIDVAHNHPNCEVCGSFSARSNERSWFGDRVPCVYKSTTTKAQAGLGNIHLSAPLGWPFPGNSREFLPLSSGWNVIPRQDIR
jgi:hypothetical protein